MVNEEYTLSETEFHKKLDRKILISKFLKWSLNAQVLIFFILLVYNPIVSLIILMLFGLVDFTIWMYLSPENINKNIVVAVYVILVFSAPLTYSIVYFIKFSILTNYPTLPIIGQVSDWILFSGSIIGGLTTMLALLFTITYQERSRLHENNQRLIELDIFHTPFLEINMSNQKDNHTYYHGYSAVIKEQKSNYSEFINLIAKNVSENTALSPHFEKFEYFESNISNEFDLGKSEECKITSIVDEVNREIKSVKMLPKGGCIPFKLAFSYTEEFKRNSVNNQRCLRFRSTLVYYGVSKKIVNKLHFSFIVYVSFDAQNKEISDSKTIISNVENKYSQSQIASN